MIPYKKGLQGFSEANKILHSPVLARVLYKSLPSMPESEQVFVYGLTEENWGPYWRDDGLKWVNIDSTSYPRKTVPKILRMTRWQLQVNGRKVDFFREQYHSFVVNVNGPFVKSKKPYVICAYMGKYKHRLTSEIRTQAVDNSYIGKNISRNNEKDALMSHLADGASFVSTVQDFFSNKFWMGVLAKSHLALNRSQKRAKQLVDAQNNQTNAEFVKQKIRALGKSEEFIAQYAEICAQRSSAIRKRQSKTASNRKSKVLTIVKRVINSLSARKTRRQINTAGVKTKEQIGGTAATSSISTLNMESFTKRSLSPTKGDIKVAQLKGNDMEDIKVLLQTPKVAVDEMNSEKEWMEGWDSLDFSDEETVLGVVRHGIQQGIFDSDEMNIVRQAVTRLEVARTGGAETLESEAETCITTSDESSESGDDFELHQMLRTHHTFSGVMEEDSFDVETGENDDLVGGRNSRRKNSSPNILKAKQNYSNSNASNTGRRELSVAGVHIKLPVVTPAEVHVGRGQRIKKVRNRFSPEDFTKRYCFCQEKNNPYLRMVKCEPHTRSSFCKIWYHWDTRKTCVSLNTKKYTENVRWTCPVCKDPDIVSSDDCSTESEDPKGDDKYQPQAGESSICSSTDTSESESEGCFDVSPPSSQSLSGAGGNRTTGLLGKSESPMHDDRDVESPNLTEQGDINRKTQEGNTGTNNKAMPSNKEGNTDAEQENLDKRLIAEILGVTCEDLDYIPPKIVSLKFDASEWEKIYDYKEGKLRKTKWATQVSVKLTEVNLCCSFRGLSQPYYSTKAYGNAIRVTGSCGGNCKMKFVGLVKEKPIRGEEVVMEMESNECFVLEQAAVTARSLSADERLRIKNKLANSKAYDVFLEFMAHAHKLRLLHNNKPFKSFHVLRQAKSEDNLKQEENFNKEIHNLITEFMEDDRFGRLSDMAGFIQQFSEYPISIHMYSPLQIKMAARWPDLEWHHCDCTGGMIRMPKEMRKRMKILQKTKAKAKLSGRKNMKAKTGRLYLYSVVATVAGTDITFPIAESILARHHEPSISNFLGTVTHEIRKQANKKKITKGVTIDFSFAFLHAVLMSYNRENITVYMLRAWNVMRNQETWPEDKSFVFICTAHLIHSFRKNLSKHGVPHQVRKLAMHSLALLQQVSTMQEFESVVGKIIQLFGSKRLSTESVRTLTLEMQCSTVEGKKDFKLIDVTVDRMSKGIFTPAGITQRASSPFFQYFKERRYSHTEKKTDTETNVEQKERQCGPKNPNYNTKVLDVIQDIYIPYFCFFASIIPATTIPGFQRSSNATVESYFSILKTLLHSIRNVFGPQFIRKHADIIIGIMKKIATMLLTTPTIIRRRRKRVHGKLVDVEDEINSQEMWSKKSTKKERKSRYFETPKLTKDSSTSKLYNATTSEQFKPSTSNRQHPNKNKLDEHAKKAEEPEIPPTSTSIPIKGSRSKKMILVDLDKEPSVAKEMLPKGHPNYYKNAVIFRSPGGVHGNANDLSTLTGDKWVNDNVVDAYCSIVADEHKNSGYTVLSSMFFRKTTRAMLSENPNLPTFTVSDAHLKGFRKIHTEVDLLLPLCHSGHWILLHFNRITGAVIVYDTIYEYFRKEFFEELIFVVWSALEPKHAHSKRFKMAKVTFQQGGVVCGTHVMQRVEDFYKNTSQDYRHEFILRKRRKIFQILLQTTDLGWEFWREFGTTDARLYAEIAKYYEEDQPSERK